MPITRIPERYKAGLTKIVALTAPQIDELAEAVGACSPTSRFADFSTAVQSYLKEGWKRDDVYDILPTLYSLALNLPDTDSPVEDFVSQLIDAMRSSARELLASEQSEAAFAKNIQRLLGIQSLRFAAKSLGLASEHAKSFCGVKIITDVRPIFANVRDKPRMALVEHILKIEYHESGNHREFFVALDDSEIVKLKEALERAQTKSASLRSLIKEAGIENFNRP